MAKKDVNMYEMHAARRKAEQDEIKHTLKKEETVTKSRKVRLDLTVPERTKSQLMEYAKQKNLSSSVIIQMLIEEHCV